MPSLGSTMEDFQQKMYSVMRSIKKHSMNTNVLPKHCIFDFPLSELSKIKCKSNYFGNEIPCPKGEGGALKMTRNGYKEIGKCSGKKSAFSPARQTTDPRFQQKRSLRQKLSCGFRRRVTLGEQEGEAQ